MAVIPRIEHLKEPPARRGFFEFEMFTKLRAELPEYLRSLITFAYNTGVVQQIGGWKTRSVFDRYNVVSARDFREAGERLEGYQQEQQAAYDAAQAKSGVRPEKVN